MNGLPDETEATLSGSSEETGPNNGNTASHRSSTRPRIAFGVVTALSSMALLAGCSSTADKTDVTPIPTIASTPENTADSPQPIVITTPEGEQFIAQEVLGSNEIFFVQNDQGGLPDVYESTGEFDENGNLIVKKVGKVNVGVDESETGMKFVIMSVEREGREPEEIVEFAYIGSDENTRYPFNILVRSLAGEDPRELPEDVANEMITMMLTQAVIDRNREVIEALNASSYASGIQYVLNNGETPQSLIPDLAYLKEIGYTTVLKDENLDLSNCYLIVTSGGKLLAFDENGTLKATGSLNDGSSIIMLMASNSEPTATPTATATPISTDTPEPTPTSTPKPTDTSITEENKEDEIIQMPPQPFGEFHTLYGIVSADRLQVEYDKNLAKWVARDEDNNLIAIWFDGFRESISHGQESSGVWLQVDDILKLPDGKEIIMLGIRSNPTEIISVVNDPDAVPSWMPRRFEFSRNREVSLMTDDRVIQILRRTLGEEFRDFSDYTPEEVFADIFSSIDSEINRIFIVHLHDRSQCAGYSGCGNLESINRFINRERNSIIIVTKTRFDKDGFSQTTAVEGGLSLIPGLAGRYKVSRNGENGQVYVRLFRMNPDNNIMFPIIGIVETY